MAGISKAFLKKLPGMVQDRENLEAIKAFLAEHGHEMRKKTICIIDDGLYFTGTVGPVTCFKLWGDYYIRARTSIDGERFRKDPAFEGSRKSAKRFAIGNQLASKLYALVKGEKKVYKLFCFLKKRAIELIKEGSTIKDAEKILVDYLKSFGAIAIKKEKPVAKQKRKYSEIAVDHEILMPHFTYRLQSWSPFAGP